MSDKEYCNKACCLNIDGVCSGPKQIQILRNRVYFGVNNINTAMENLLNLEAEYLTYDCSGKTMKLLMKNERDY